MRGSPPLNRRVWPDPAGSWCRTVGGMIGVGARGARSLRHGSVPDAVIQARVCFANGETGTLPTAVKAPEWDLGPVDRPFVGTLNDRLATLANWHESRRPGPSVPSEDRRPLTDEHGDPRPDRLLGGSFGTLAMIAEVTLKTVPIPGAQRVLILPFDRITHAASAIASCLTEGPSRCELVDWRMLRHARESDPFWADAAPDRAEAALIVEFDGIEAEGPSSRARSLVRRLSMGHVRPLGIIELTRKADCDRAFGLRRAAEPRLMSGSGRSRPTAVVPALEVPPERWAEFINDLQPLFRRHDLNWTIHGCVGSGQIRARPFLDLGAPRDRAQVAGLATAMIAAAERSGGRPAGRWVRRVGGGDGPASPMDPSAILRRQVKAIFDPNGILQPGLMTFDDGEPAPRPMLAPVAPPASIAPMPIIDPKFQWRDEGRGMLDQAAACNGCGGCRSFEPALRICPSFRASRREGETPRALAGLIRGIASGAIDRDAWGSEAVRRAADHCIHCRLCEQECPSGIDISTMMMEVKAAYADLHGLGPSEWFLARIELWSRLASRMPRTFNALIGSPRLRWLLERTLGLSRHRCLPRACRTPFVRRAERMGLAEPAADRGGPRVVYFLDLIANYYDHAIAEGAVSVLRHCGVSVFVPKRQQGCGMPYLVAGDVDSAREVALANLRILGNAVREGYTVVCSEPTALLMLRNDYPRLTDDLDAGLVAANAMDLGRYLLGLGDRGLLPRPELPIHARVGYHLPCHLRALDIGVPALELLGQIPEMEVEHIDRGCSGMAGSFGLSRGHFRTSLRAGRGLRDRMKGPDIELGAAECAACRIQMEQGNRKRTYHPITLLAMSHGFLPGEMRRLRRPRDRRFALGTRRGRV